MRLLLRFLAWLDLPANHRVGALAGRLVYLLSPRFRLRTLENLRTAGLAPDGEALARLARENAAHIGKGATELRLQLEFPGPPEGTRGRQRRLERCSCHRAANGVRADGSASAVQQAGPGPGTARRVVACCD